MNISIEKVLIEYAKVQIQLIIAGEKIAELQAQIAAMAPKSPAPEQI